MSAAVAVALLAALAASDPDQDRLARGEVVVRTEKVAGSDMPRAIVRAVIDAPPEKVWALLVDCARYRSTMPRIAASALVKKEGSVAFCRITTDLPFPLPDLTSLTRAEHTVGDGRWTRTWRLVEGDYKTNEGSWTLTRFGGQEARTLVEYRIHAEPSLPVPKGILASAQTSALPDLIERLRAQTAGR